MDRSQFHPSSNPSLRFTNSPATPLPARTLRARDPRAAEAVARRLAVLASGLLIAFALLVSGPAPAAGGDAASLEGVVNINTATAEELRLLPGVGEKRAADIISMRRTQGAFKTVDALIEVKGVGPALLERFRAHVVLTGKTTAKAL